MSLFYIKKHHTLPLYWVVFFVFFSPLLFSQVLLYSENMYNGAGGASGDNIATHEANNRFNLDGLTYSGTGDMRTTTASSGYPNASGTWNVMLNAAAETFVMHGLAMGGSCGALGNVNVGFGVRKGTLASDGSTLILEYSTAGVGGPWTSVSFGLLPTGAGTSIWYYVYSAAIPKTATTIRFRTTDATEFRIDDLKIECECSADSQPTTPSSSFIVTPNCNFAHINFQRGNGDSCIVVMSTNCTITDPSDLTYYADNNQYTLGATTGAGDYVVYNGNGNSFYVVGLTPSTSYCFKVYEYNVNTNRTSCSENYLVTAVTTTFTTTAACGPLFNEGFDEANGSTSGSASGVNWAVACAGCSGTTTVQAGVLESNNTDVISTFTTASIDISPCTEDFYIRFDLTEVGDMEPCYFDGTAITSGNGVDYVALEYELDGGGFIAAPYTYNCGHGALNSTAVIRSGNGNLNYNTGCIPAGSTLRLKLSFLTWATDEYWRVDNIQVGCMSCVWLPIGLTFFNASCVDQQSSIFSWQTISERENDYFVIEYTSDGANIETLGIVDGAGNSLNELNYQFKSERVFDKKTVFRLKQVDLNGNYSYSSWTDAQCDFGDKLEVFPNPSTGTFVIQSYPKNATITVLNPLSQPILEYSPLEPSMFLDLKNYSDGVYYVVIQSDNFFETKKIIKQK
ncbi:MAG: T9SS type A sorting domain-containing protein [Flavobacteriia bacterium]|nr:T9SS type A sorting domain-containing protein [Flavobacteriia bacterium]